MENASKALLIAASILIVILLIAVGMKVFNSTAGTTDNVETTMNATEIATFNNKFTGYLGTKNRAQAMSLINLIISNNSTSEHKVSVSYAIKINGVTHKSNSTPSSEINSLNTLLNNISQTTNADKFKIKINEYKNSFISEINITN